MLQNNSSDKEKENIEDESHHEKETKGNLKGDYGNVAILLFLYLLQGIPLGISSAVPILLQNRGVTYAEQAIFTFAFYPFTLKILWAPLVDSVYIRAFGRRKTWLIPSQVLIGAFMIYLAQNVDSWMGDGDKKKPEMILLTSVFFLLWFLTATQDIAVDGWALTMLQRRNVGHAATCNAVGQTAGGFIGYVVFLVLESKDFSSKYIYNEPKEVGLVTLSGFLYFWGVIFLICTALVGLLKKENSDAELELENNPDFGVSKAYPLLWKIIRLKPIMKFSIVLLTVKASFAACDAVTTLKLIDYGLPKDKIAILSIPLVPLQIVLPFIISRFTTGPYPMTFYIKAFPYRLIMTIVIGVFVYFTPTMITNSSDIPTYYYVSIVSIYLIYQLPLRAMYVADMAFMARISDPLVGASYMTLLNTLSNLGGRWVKTFFLWLVDIITWRNCVNQDPNYSNITSIVESFSYLNSTVHSTIHSTLNSTSSENMESSLISMLESNKCASKDERSICGDLGGKCITEIDGYYIEVGLNVIYGICWYFWGKVTLEYLQKLPISDWHILSSKESNEMDEVTSPLHEQKDKAQN